MNQCCQPFCDRSVARRAQLKRFAVVFAVVLVFQVYVAWSFPSVHRVIVGVSMLLAPILGVIIILFSTFFRWPLHRGKETFLCALDYLFFVSLNIVSFAGFFLEELKSASLWANAIIALRIFIVVASLNESKKAVQNTSDSGRNLD